MSAAAWRVAGAALCCALLPARAGSADAYSANYRLVGPGPASVSAVGNSPVYSLYVVGGAGQPVGISASANVSVVTGGASNLLPTGRIFRSGMEG